MSDPGNISGRRIGRPRNPYQPHLQPTISRTEETVHMRTVHVENLYVANTYLPGSVKQQGKLKEG